MLSYLKDKISGVATTETQLKAGPIINANIESATEVKAKVRYVLAP